MNLCRRINWIDKMKIITVEIKNDIAMKLLHSLESLHLIRLMTDKPKKKKVKISEKFAGSISMERANELQLELTKTRKEWERDIS